MTHTQKPQTPLPPIPWDEEIESKEGPPTLIGLLRICRYNFEQIVAYAHDSALQYHDGAYSLNEIENRARLSASRISDEALERDEKLREAEEQVIQRSRDVVIFWSLSFDKKATQEEVIRTIQELAKSLVDLKALTPTQKKGQNK